MATSQPPPKAWPFSAATTGTGSVATRSSRDRIVRAMAWASASVRIVPSSFRSPPETKTRSPAPRRATTRTSGEAATSSRAAPSSAIVGRLMAFWACGRSITIRAA